MRELTREIYQDRIKSSHNRIVTVKALLLVFIISFSLIFTKEYLKLQKYKLMLVEVNEILECPRGKVTSMNDSFEFQKCPWRDIESIYNNSFSVLEDYINEYSKPYSSFCFLTNLNAHVSDVLSEEGDRFSKKSKDAMEYSAFTLAEYNNELRSVLAYQKTGTQFQELDIKKLKKTLSIFKFRIKTDTTLLRSGIENSFIAANKLIGLDASGIYRVNKKFTKKIYKNSIKNLDGYFESYDVIMLNFYDPLFSKIFHEDNLVFFDETIDLMEKYGYNSFKEVFNNEKKLPAKISAINHGDNIEIPILNINISLNQTVLFGGLINLGILLYFYFMSINLKILSYRLDESIENVFSIEDKRALFFGLDYHISNQWVYLIVNVLFFSSISILSIILGQVFFKYNMDVAFLISVLICIINIYVSFIISKTIFQLDKD